MSVPAGFGGVRCKINSVSVKWRDDGGVFFFFFEGEGGNNKVVGCDISSWSNKVWELA